MGGKPRTLPELFSEATSNFRGDWNPGIIKESSYSPKPMASNNRESGSLKMNHSLFDVLRATLSTTETFQEKKSTAKTQSRRLAAPLCLRFIYSLSYLKISNF